MKLFLVSLVALVAGAAAQDKLPSCANDCVTKFTSGSSIGKCAQLDVKCICSDKALLNNLACCLASACDQAGQQQAVKFAAQICAGQGVKTPDQVVCSSGSSAAPTATRTGGSSSASGAAAPTGRPGNATNTAGASKPTNGAAVGRPGAGGVLGAVAAAAVVYVL